MSAAERAFSGPKRVTSRPKSWFESTQAAPGRAVVAAIAVRSGSASHRAISSSKANARSRLSRYGCHRALGRYTSPTSR